MNRTESNGSGGRPWADPNDEPRIEPEIFNQQQLTRHIPQQMATTDTDYSAFLTAAQSGPPRDIVAMIATAKQIGGLLGSAAFYRWPSRGKNVQGPSVKLARALAQAWGRNVTRTTIEDLGGDKVNVRGLFVDLQTIAIVECDYPATLSKAPGKFAKDKEQSARWRIMQEQAASSKAIRGAILGGLPDWYTDAALTAAFAAAAKSATGGRPLAEVRADALASLQQQGLTRADVESWVGSPVDLWAAEELGRLRSLFRDLRNGSISTESIRVQTAPAVAPRSSGGRAALGLAAPSGPLPAQVVKPKPAPPGGPVKAPPQKTEEEAEIDTAFDDFEKKRKARLDAALGEALPPGVDEDEPTQSELYEKCKAAQKGLSSNEVRAAKLSAGMDIDSRLTKNKPAAVLRDYLDSLLFAQEAALQAGF